MTSTASIVSAGEILKQDSLGRVRTPLAKRQEILAAFDGSGRIKANIILNPIVPALHYFDTVFHAKTWRPLGEKLRVRSIR